MGTKGILSIKYKNKYLEKYNSDDSYIGGLGATIISFINLVISENGWQVFKEMFEKLDIRDEDELIEDKEIIKQYRKYADLTVKEKSLSSWYCLQRKLQRGVFLYELYKGKIKHTAFDDTFGGYIYKINLNKMYIKIQAGNKKIILSLEKKIDFSILEEDF